MTAAVTSLLEVAPENIAHATLANGLDLYVLPDHRLPLVTHSVWYKVGARDEAVGQTGMAHLFEHLMFKGTKKNPPGSFEAYVTKKGGWHNAATGCDFTFYVASLPSRCLADVMAYDADRMHGLELTPAQIDTERKVVLEEIAGYESDAGYLASAKFNALQFAGHRMAIPIAGTQADLKAADHASLLAFYRQHYAPANASVIVCGDVTAEDAMALAQKTFGALPRSAPLPYERPPIPGSKKLRFEFSHDQVANMSAFRRYAMSMESVSLEDSIALEFLACVHNSNYFPDGHMHRLVYGEKLATSASVMHLCQGVEMFAVGIEAAAGVGPEVLEAKLDESIGRMRAELPDAQVLETMKRMYAINRLKECEYRYSRILNLGQSLHMGCTLDEYRQADALTAALTLADLRRVIDRYLDDDRAITGLVMPPENAGVSEMAAGG